MSVIDGFRDLPWPIRLAAVCLVAALGIALLVMALEPWSSRRRARTTDQRTRHRAQQERADLRATKRVTSTDTHVGRMDTHVGDPDMRNPVADKPPSQQADTAGLVAVPRKLPGQGRLTRDPGTTSQVKPGWAADHLSGAGSPSQRPDPPLAAAQPPPLRSGDPSLAQQGGLDPVQPAPGGSTADVALPAHPATTQMPAVLPPVPAWQKPLSETRQQRRERLEALIDQEAAERDRPQRPSD